MRSIEQELDTREKRRFATANRYMDRMGKRWDAADTMIGELVREGKKVTYINLCKMDGRMTGRTKEGSRQELRDYLIRNNYA